MGREAGTPGMAAPRARTRPPASAGRRPPSATGARAGSALVAGSLLLSGAACEGIVRIAGPDLTVPQAAGHFRFTQTFEFELPHHRRDPVLGWRLQPGVYGKMRINSEGFRGPEWQRGPAAAKRIAHLGDSSTMGFSIGDDADIYAALLPALGAREGLRLEALNFGVDGYSSHQGRLLLAQVLRDYAPNYVTLYFGYNDHHYSNASDRDTRFSTPWIVTALEHSHAYRFLRRQLLLVVHREGRLVQPERRVDVNTFEDNLRRMVEAARAAGTIPILMTTPLRPGVPLIENEVPVTVEGKPRWVTQDWWVNEQLGGRGLDVERAGGTEALRQFLDAALQEHPDWAYLHYLRARELERAGDVAGARAALAQVALHDGERSLLGQYNERVRMVARSLQVELVDLARLFEARPSLHLFNDVVHPSAAGHALIAQALVATLRRLETRASAPAPGAAEGG